MLTNVSEADGGLYICLTTAPDKSLINVTEDENNENESLAANTEEHNHSEKNDEKISSSQDFSSIITTSSTSPTATGSSRKSIRNSTRIEDEFQEYLRAKLSVRTPPGPVTQLYFKASTILGFLIWRFNQTNSGGYPIRSFTAEFRNVSYNETPISKADEHEWSRMDPINIAPNVVSIKNTSILLSVIFCFVTLSYIFLTLHVIFQ